MTGDGPPPVLVTVSGPGHHDRAGVAATVLDRLRSLGVEVAVSADLRPRLAADVAALLDAGAARILLAGEAMSAVARPDAGGSDEREGRHLSGAAVVVRLSAAAGPMRVEVPDGDRSPLAVQVAAALEGVIP